MGGVVLGDDVDPIPVDDQLVDRAVALFLIENRRMDVEIPYPAEHQIQRAAVGDDDRRLVGTERRPEAIERREDALPLVEEALAALGAGLGSRVADLAQRELGMAEEQFAVVKALKNAEVPLPPSAVGREFAADRPGDGPGGFEGSAEIGSDQSVDRVPIGEPLGQRRSLLVAAIGQRDRGPPLDPTLAVPLGLAVPNQHQPCHVRPSRRQVVTLAFAPDRVGVMPVEVKLYSRADCHLCEDAKATIKRVAADVDTPVTIEEVDVDKDETLRAEYGERVPYVFVDGWPAFKYEVDAEELRRQLQEA